MAAVQMRDCTIRRVGPGRAASVGPEPLEEDNRLVHLGERPTIWPSGGLGIRLRQMTKPRASATRERLLEAAILEIADKGIGGIRTRSVAERAGVNSALIHYHFKSMDDLVAEATATAFSALAEPAMESLTAPTIGEGIGILSAAIGSIDPDDPGWAVLLEVMVHAPRHPQLGGFVMGWLRGYRTAMRHRLDQAVEEGELPASTDTEGLSLALMALLDGLGLYAYIAPDLDVGRAAASFTQLISNPTQGDPT